MFEDIVRRLKELGINANIIRLGDLPTGPCNNPTCPKCSDQLRDIATISPEDEVALLQLKTRLKTAENLYQETASKVQADYDRLMADWKDRYRLHNYKEFGLEGNVLKGLPR